MKITIFYHSMVDIITNSSTELFCRVLSPEFIDDIAKELSIIFNRKVEPFGYDDDEKSIQFDIEYGDNQILTDDFCNMLEHILLDKFSSGNFIIDRNVSY